MKHKKIFEEGKYVPQRMCICCRSVFPKSTLIRVGGFKDGSAALASSGGRGVYVCKSEKCLEMLVKTRGLSRGLKRNVPENVYEECITLDR